MDPKNNVKSKRKKIDINKEKKKHDLLSAAYELFTTIGVPNTTITQIAQRAKVGKGTFYLYFKDKYAIQDALITIKSSEIFQEAMTSLNKHCATIADSLSVSDKIIYITDYIITKLSKDLALLQYISKDLSWGLYSIPAFRTEDEKELLDFRTYTESMLKKDGVRLKDFDMTVFTIVELINSTCYNVILHGEPATFSEYKLYLFRCIRLIINDGISPLPSPCGER